MKTHLLTLLFLTLLLRAGAQPTVSFTFDDMATGETPLWSLDERNARMLQALDKHHVKATLFVTGRYTEDAKGRKVLASWDDAGHQIANHSYRHRYYNAKDYTAAQFEVDFRKADSAIAGCRHYAKLFRFPYLKEGETREKRDATRALFAAQGYRNGHVSIDASDWYFDKIVKDTLAKNPAADLAPYRTLYLAHIRDRALFYDSLATAVTGRKVKHSLVLHYNLINALFLDDLMQAFRDLGWNLIDAAAAWDDPIYAESPDVVPAGEGIVWQLAKAAGVPLRYPAEDAAYEAPKVQAYLDAARRKDHE